MHQSVTSAWNTAMTAIRQHLHHRYVCRGDQLGAEESARRVSRRHGPVSLGSALPVHLKPRKREDEQARHQCDPARGEVAAPSHLLLPRPAGDPQVRSGRSTFTGARSLLLRTGRCHERCRRGRCHARHTPCSSRMAAYPATRARMSAGTSCSAFRCLRRASDRWRGMRRRPQTSDASPLRGGPRTAASFGFRACETSP